MAAVQKLVLQDKVFGIVPIVSEAFQPAASDFLLKNKVPFTGFGFQPGFCGNAAGFGFNGCLVGSANNASTVGPLTQVLPKGSKLALVMDDASSGTSALKQITAAAKYYGYQVVYGKAELPVDHPVTDFTPYTSAIIASHPDAVYTDSGAFANVVGLDGALKAAGYKGPTVNFSTYASGLLDTPSVAQAVDGAYINVQFAPPEQGGAAINLIKTDLAAIGEKPDINLGVATSFWSAELMIAMLQKVGRNLTPDTFLNTINAGFTWTPSPAGGVGPETFPAAHQDPTPCAALVQAKGTAYVSAAKFSCYKILR
jgi:ABC-type branched-subunit amino acid transport system substrate-binding protein